MGTETSLACFGSENEGKYLKVSGTGYMWEGQKTELYSSPPTASLVVQCSALISSSRSQTKKNFRHNRGQKNVFKGVGAGNLKKNTTNTSLDADFSPILYLTFPSFHRAPYHWTTIIPSYGFSNRAGKNKWVLQRVLGYCVHSTFSG